jgi:hypothetical protein
LKNAILAFFNLAKLAAVSLVAKQARLSATVLLAARKITTYVVTLLAAWPSLLLGGSPAKQRTSLQPSSLVD